MEQYSNNKKPQSELFFDPSNHPDDTLKAFDEFTQLFELRYDAQFPDPPKVSLDGAIARWKVQHTTEAQADPKPTLEQYDEIVATWQSKDKVAKFLGMFSSSRFYTDWQAAQPDADQRKAATWTTFLNSIKEYYRPTENMVLKRYQFRHLVQESGESFAAYVNRVEKEAKHCSFKCHHGDCTAENVAVADQVVYRTMVDKIREEAILKSWDLPTLRREGTRMETATKSGATISGESVNRLGRFSHKTIRGNNGTERPRKSSLTCFNCGQNVTTPIQKHVRKDCPAIGKKCDGCGNTGHLTHLCKKTKVHLVSPDPSSQQGAPADVTPDTEQPTYNINIFQVEPCPDRVYSTSSQQVQNQNNTAKTLATSATLLTTAMIPQEQPMSFAFTFEHADVSTVTSTVPTTSTLTSVDPTSSTSADSTTTVADPTITTPQDDPTPEPLSDGPQEYDINIFRIEAPKNKVLPSWRSAANNDFRAPVVVNNSLASPIADTGAKVSVCGSVQANRWKLLDRMLPSEVKLKPYNSSPISVLGVARCAVTFGSTSVPVEWHIISGSCEPILAGSAALQLGIIKFARSPGAFHPVLMIDKDAIGSAKEKVQSILQDYPQNFQGLGRLKGHQIKLHVKPDVKPVRDAPRPTPYHMEGRAAAALDNMLKADVIEEHPVNEPAPWVSNVVLAPKDDGELRVTMDARNVNKAIQSSNLPIPKQEDIKAKLAHKKYFSKLDFKSAFWQLELAPESRYLTVFQIFDQLYRYKVLTMGLKPAQGELNATLSPLFGHIADVYLIHDDIIIATDTIDEHVLALQESMEVISISGLTLNPAKCTFCQREIKFWGMIFGEYGVRPDPEKVDDLYYITPPQNKPELISFLCMMQSNSDFIPQFAKKSAVLRELTKGDTTFSWEPKHQQCFDQLLKEFKKDVTLRYFDKEKRTFVITDAHKSGLGIILAQGDDLKSARAVAVASRRTTPAEQHYPQIDLEGTGVDYGLTRFRKYLVGSPDITMVITDHKPLVSIFNGKRKGSIRTEKIKLRNQDIDFSVQYQKGTSNQADYLSRHAKPFEKTSPEDQENAREVNKLLYVLHTTPIMDYIGLSTIAEETEKDPTLAQLRTILKRSQTWIPKNAPEALQKFSKIISELTVTGNGIILKSERIVLPEKLQREAIELAHRGSHPMQSINQSINQFFFY